LEPHNDSGSVSSDVVSTVGTICDGSVTSASNPSSIHTVGNFINTGPVPTVEQTFTTASGAEFTVDCLRKDLKMGKTSTQIRPMYSGCEYIILTTSQQVRVPCFYQICVFCLIHRDSGTS